MNEGFERLRAYLDAEGVSYHVIHHPTDYRARQAAADTGTPAEDFAKTVFVWIDGKPAMAVVPANKGVALGKLAKAVAAEEVRVARESETRELCPDCDLGAAPPFGHLYDLPVYVSVSLAQEERITFNGGTHEDAIQLAWKDFERLVGPRVVRIAKHE
jgi:Ala-tRNA(Pro) deacylase